MNTLILQTNEASEFASSKISSQRRLEILQASRDVLSQGYTDYSMRKVAAAAGVRLNTVQYHFNNLQNLIEATCLWTLEEYLEKYRDMSTGSNLSPLDSLNTYLDISFKGLANRHLRSFYIELWAMALHNPPLAVLLRSAYADYRDSISKIIIGINPKLTVQDADLLVTLILSWGEGLIVLTEWGGDQEKASFERLCNKMKKFCIALVLGD